MTYWLTVKFEEKNHSIEENWQCKSLKSLKQRLGEALDITIDKNRIPKKPVYEELYSNLNKYADEEFIKDEFKRMDKNYSIYLEILKDMNNGDDYSNTYDIDKNTYVYIYIDDK